MTARPMTLSLLVLFGGLAAFAAFPQLLVFLGYALIYIAPIMIVSLLWGLRDL
jgi:hypothetical protein